MRNMTSEQVAAASGGAILCLLLLLFRLLLVAVTHSPSIDLFNDVLLAIYLSMYLSISRALSPPPRSFQFFVAKHGPLWFATHTTLRPVLSKG